MFSLQAGIEETGGTLGRGRGEEARRRRFLDDLAVVHEDHPAADLPRETHFVRHDEHRHAFGGELAHDCQHLAPELRVERGGRLVEQQHLRLHGQRPRDGHALLLTAG